VKLPGHRPTERLPLCRVWARPARVRSCSSLSNSANIANSSVQAVNLAKIRDLLGIESSIRIRVSTISLSLLRSTPTETADHATVAKNHRRWLEAFRFDRELTLAGSSAVCSGLRDVAMGGGSWILLRNANLIRRSFHACNSTARARTGAAYRAYRACTAPVHPHRRCEGRPC
jgi:hypothetical protein